MSIITGTYGYKAEKITVKYFDSSAVLKIPVFEKVYKGVGKDPAWNNFTIEIWFPEAKMAKATEMHEQALRHNSLAVTGTFETQKWQGTESEVTTLIIKPLQYWEVAFFTKEIPVEGQGRGTPPAVQTVAPATASQLNDDVPF